MTHRKAEYLIDAEIQTETVDGYTRASAVITDDGYEPLGVSGKGRSEKIACAELAEAVYGLRSLRCFERDDWKCTYCRCVKPLQIHHAPFRSHGGRHVMSEMRSCCSDCHENKHRPAVTKQ